MHYHEILDTLIDFFHSQNIFVYEKIILLKFLLCEIKGTVYRSIEVQ